MKRIRLRGAVPIWFSLLLLCGPFTAKGDRLVNGNFETFTNGLPVGWNYSPDNVGPAVLQSSAFTSPFTNIYPAGNFSVLLTNAPSVVPQPQLSQNFAALGGRFSLSFDFRLSGILQGSAWDVLPLSGGGVVPFDLFINRGGGFSATDGFSIDPVESLDANTWYHVAINGNLSSDQYSGFVTQFGGTTFSWSNFSFLSSVSVLDGISINNDAASDSANTPIYFDNFSVGPTPAPEPSVTALAVAGALLAFVWRRAR